MVQNRNKRRKKALLVQSLSLALIVAVLAIIVIFIVRGVDKVNKAKKKETAKATTETTEQSSTSTKTGETESEEATTKPTTAEPTTEDPRVVIHLAAVGDNLLHKGITNLGLKKEDGGLDYTFLYDQMKPVISQVDIAIVNQEVPLAGTEFGISGYPDFNSNPEVADALWATGFNVFSMATNHCLDMGVDGANATLNYIHRSLPLLTTVGLHQSEEDRDTIRFFNIKNKNVAILNYTYDVNRGTAEPYVVNVYSPELVEKDVALAREKGDFIIVCMHWGEEYSKTPSAKQKEQAQYLCDLGVDLIIGTHPHVVQPKEWLTGKDGNKTCCYYSLGNFISLQDEPDRMLGGVALVDIVLEKDGVSIKNASLDFCVTHYNADFSVCKVYPLAAYTDDLAADHYLAVSGKNFTREWLLSLAEELQK